LLTEALISADTPRNGLLKVTAGGVLTGILTPLLPPLIDQISGTPGDFRIVLVAIPFAVLVFMLLRRCSANRWWAALLAAIAPASRGNRIPISSSALRNLIEKPGDAADPPIPDDGEIGALDRAVGAVGTEAPRETDVLAKSVCFAEQPKPEIRKALLHACDQRIDAVMAIA
jgi:hypothetical protein